MKTVFIVDDNTVNLLSVEEALSGDYRVFTLRSANAMFELLESVRPDLILLDIEMPDTDGFEALSVLKENKRDAEIPVIFLTGRNDPSTEIFCFERGAVDFISKPFPKPVLRNRVKTHLDIEAIIRERTESLRRLKGSIVNTLANMVENRDKLTGRHIERTTMYIRILLGAMLEHGVYADEIRLWDVEEAVSSARLHDVGKVTVSDLIINKPGKLTAAEFEAVKAHTTEGEKIIDGIIADSGDASFLQNARLFAGSHHERWDGTGYPRGLKGAGIPLQGRIMALVDVYDALISERPYKKAFTQEKAVGIIRESSGNHFDPKIAEVFLAISGRFAEISP